MLRTNPEEVACAPLKPQDVEKVTSSIASLASKDEDLRALKVLFAAPALDLVPGDFVYLRPESYSAPYMRMVYQVDGVKFVLVPKNMVIMHKKTSY